MQQRQLDYEKAVAAAESLSQEMDRMIAQSQIMNQECAEAKKNSNHLTRENKRLQKELADLARQVSDLGAGYLRIRVNLIRKIDYFTFPGLKSANSLGKQCTDVALA